MRINGEALQALRESNGLSITELARMADVDRTVLGRIERGQRKGTAAQHKALAAALGVRMAAIAYAEAVA